MFKQGVISRISKTHQQQPMLIIPSSSTKRLTRNQVKQLIVQESSSKDKIKFSLFLKTVLDFQLREHEKFLAPFAEHFRALDLNNDGVLDEKEFRLLMQRLSHVVPPQSVETYLHVIDPYNN